MKTNRGVSMVTLVITIVVILILAMIAFGSSGQVIEKTDYSKFVNNVSEVGYAFDNASVDIQGSSMLINNKKRDEQIYNFIAKGGEKEKDFLIMSKVPDYTIIQDSADIGMDLPEMKIESGTGRMVAAKYVTTKGGQIFVWPPFEHEDKLYITETDTVDHKMQTNITVGGEDIVIELDPEWGSIIDIVIEQDPEETPEDNNPSDGTHEHDFSAKEATEEYFFAAATCTTSEKYYYKCLYCEEKGTNTYNWGNPLDHTFGEFTVVSEGNCGGPGSKKRVCTRCNFSEFVSIPKNSANHIGGEVSVMKTVANCASTGLEEIKCKTCNVVFRTNTLEKDPNNHAGNTKTETTVKPTCTTTGTQVEKCSACNKTIKTETLKALGHSFGEYVSTKTANCVTKGIQERTCTTCNVKETIETDKDPENHSGGSTEKEIIDATCTREGETITKCSLCKAKLGSTKIAAKGHNFTNKTTDDKYLKSEATCVAASVYYFKCASCDASASSSATPEAYTYLAGELDKTNHVGNVEEHYTAPTATAEGRRWTTCSACGAELSSEIIPKLAAVAVYSADDNSLRFYKNTDVITAGAMYNGKTVTHIYSGFENEKYTEATEVPWSGVASKVTNVVVHNEISPISLAFWFENFVNASTFDVSKVNTSNTTSLMATFRSAGYDVESFKITGLDNWDVRNVAIMSGMFQYAGRNSKSFNIGNLSSWKTSSLTHSLGMFYIAGYSATTFDIGNLDNWDMSKVTNMTGMFYRAGQSATTWNIGDLSNWNTASTIKMLDVFAWAGYSASTFDIGDLSKWNTSKVTDMTNMFCSAGYKSGTFDIGNLNNWDVSRVTNMSSMFHAAGYSATTWNIGNLSNWKTLSATNMSSMFHAAGYSATTWNVGNLSNWDTSAVTNMASMFNSAGYKTTTFDVGNLGKWNTSKVTNMYRMFYYSGYSASTWNIGDLSNWNTSKVTNMAFMFFAAGYNSTTPITLNLSGWNTSKVIDSSEDENDGMKEMFGQMRRLYTITLGENFSTTGNGTCTGFSLPVVDRVYFKEADGKWYDVATKVGYAPNAIPTNTAATYTIENLEPILAPNSTWFDQGGTTINRNQISSITFVNTYNATGKTIIDQWDASASSTGASDNSGPVTAYVENDGLGQGTYKLTIAGNGIGKVYANPDSSYAFGNTTANSGDAFINMTTFTGGNVFDTSKATTIEKIFLYAEKLKNADVENWDIGNVTSVEGAFGYCNAVESVDVGNWDTSKLENMYGLFIHCDSLKEVDVATKTVTAHGRTYTAWDTSNVTNMEFVFATRSNEFLGKLTKIDVENWNTSKVTSFESMFMGCASLTSLDLSKWDTSNVTTLEHMFSDCISMTSYNFTGWDTSKVTSMNCMFNDNRSIEVLDVSDFDTESLKFLTQTFEHCWELKEIRGLENWNTSALQSTFQAFSSSSKLKELNLSSFDTSNILCATMMFNGCRELEKIYVSEKWDLSNVLDTECIVDDVVQSGYDQHIFANCQKLVGGAGTKWLENRVDYVANAVDKQYAHIDEGASNPGYLTHISMKEEPMLAANSTWYSQGGTTINRNQISSITIADSYGVAGKTIVDQWDASASSTGANDDIGPVTAYVEDDGLGKGTYKLTIAGNGTGKVYANPDSSQVFSNNFDTWAPDETKAFSKLTLINNIALIDTSRAINMSYMFSGAGYSADSFAISGLENWNTENVLYMHHMFSGTGYNAETYDIGDLSAWDTSKVISAAAMFFRAAYSANTFDIGNIGNWETGNITDMAGMFMSAGESATTFEIGDLSNWNTSKVKNMRQMFSLAGKNDTTWNIGDLSTKEVTANGNTYVAWNMSKVTDIACMFFGGNNITELNIGNWDTSNVTNMEFLFMHCNRLTGLDVSNWNTNNVTDMNATFACCFELTNIDVSNWNTSKVKNMRQMFQSCHNVSNLDVSKFDTNNVTDMSLMFAACYKLEELNLSNWDTSAVKISYRMFGYCGNLKTIYASEKWNMSNLKDEMVEINPTEYISSRGQMFIGNNSLVGGAGTQYATNHIEYSETVNDDSIYAHIDEGSSNPGYLTDIEIKNEPVLAANSTWYSQGGSTIARNQISSVTIADSYNTTGKTIVDQWDASQNSKGANDNIGPVTAYVEDDGLGKGTYKLTIAGNGTGKVYANPDSSFVLGTSKEESGDAFINMTAFNGGELFDTSRATTLERFFVYAKSLKSANVENWDVSNVTNIRGTFSYCPSLESLDLTNWNVGKVTDMYYMFGTKISSTGPMKLVSVGNLSNWDTRNVTDMYCMFQGCANLRSIDVGKWDTSKVTNMQGMFYGCEALTELDVATKTVTANGRTYTAWNTGNVTTMNNMFCTTSNEFLGKITKLEVENWDTSSCVDMAGLFNGCASLTNLDLSNWNVSKVTDMSWMFADCINLKEINFSGWNTSSLTKTQCMFNDCQTIEVLDVSDFDTQNVWSFSQAFESCFELKEIIGLENFDTSSLKVMFQMFNNSNKLTELDLSSFDTSKVTSICQAFRGCSSLETIYVSDKWNLSSLEDDEYAVDDNFATGDRQHVFEGCYKLVGGAGTVYTTTHVDYTTNSKDAIYAHIDEGSSNPGYLTDIEMKNEPVLAANSTWYSQGGTTINRNQISSITIADSYNTTGKTIVDQWDASQNSKGASDNIGPVTAYVEDDSLGKGTYKLTIAGNGTGKVYANPDSLMAFGMRTAESGDAFVSMTSFNGGEIFDLSRATTTKAMFVYAQSLQNINASNWNMSNVTDMSHMFSNNQSLLEIDVSNWNTSNVTTIRTMFQNCLKLTEVNTTNWNTNKVTDMSYIFNQCNELRNVDVSNWNTSNVTEMKATFQGCYNVEKINVSNWNVNKVTDMSYLFNRSYKVTELDIDNWDVSNVTSFEALFKECESLTSLDVGKWNTKKATKMNHMFYGLSKIEELDLSSFDTSLCTNMGYMFAGSISLKKIYVSEKWNVNNLTNDTYTPAIGESYQADSKIFKDCLSLIGGAGTKYSDNHLDYSTDSADYIYAHIDEGASNPGYLTDKFAEVAFAIYSTADQSLRFYRDTAVPTAGSTYEGRAATKVYTEIENSEFATASNVPWYNEAGSIKTVVVENVVSPISTDYWFHGFKAATSMDLAKLDTSKTVTMHSMFYQAGYNTNNFVLTGLENWDTSKVQWMTLMFSQMGYNTTNFALDLSEWDTSDVEYMSTMFYMTGYNSSSFELIGLNGWDTSSLYAADGMFGEAGYNSTGITLDLSGWDTTKATNLSNMFAGMRKLSKITLGKNFSFTGNGTTSCTLPTPTSENITGADGKWYNTLTKVAYTPANVPNKTAATYSAVNPNVYTAILYSDGTLVFQTTNSKDTSYGSVVKEFTNWNTETYTPTLVSGSGGYFDSYGMPPPTSVSATGTPWDSYKTSIKKVIIKNGVTVSSDMDYWFANCTNLSSVEIGSGITRLGEGCFYNCTGLKTITIPTNIVYVDKFVFIKSGLTSMTIGGTNAWSTIWPVATTSTNAEMTAAKMTDSSSVGSMGAMSGSGACEWSRSATGGGEYIPQNYCSECGEALRGGKCPVCNLTNVETM